MGYYLLDIGLHMAAIYAVFTGATPRVPAEDGIRYSRYMQLASATFG
ncbi:hypothetical protein CASFOL_041984 [Castilleja foliolosa]|uniref:Uncharacterized protein n=1 Tax=Castilleja foliolosa TaxID=1961234 RepID=A0ABD3B974_9LAMI